MNLILEIKIFLINFTKKNNMTKNKKDDSKQNDGLKKMYQKHIKKTKEKNFILQQKQEKIFEAKNSLKRIEEIIYGRNVSNKFIRNVVTKFPNTIKKLNNLISNGKKSADYEEINENLQKLTDGFKFFEMIQNELLNISSFIEKTSEEIKIIKRDSLTFTKELIELFNRNYNKNTLVFDYPFNGLKKNKNGSKKKANIQQKLGDLFEDNTDMEYWQ